MASRVKASELQVNRALLDPDFKGYKLSLAPIWHHDVEIPAVDEAFTSNDQYSYLHQKEFSLFNHLHWNIWTRDGVYFVDKERRVLKIRVRCTIKDSLHVLSFSSSSDHCVPKTSSEFFEVWQVPLTRPRDAGDYNVSISFASKGIAILGDGLDTVYLLDVQEDAPSWNVITSFQMSSTYSGFTVDACRAFSGDNKVICLLRRIEKSKDPQPPRRDHSNFENHISFLCFTRDEADWKAELSADVECRGNIDYLAIEPSGEAAYLVVTDPCFGRSQEDEKEEEVKYSWRQSFNDLTIWFETDQDISKEEIEVSIAVDRIRIKVKGEEYLADRLFKPVQGDLSTFSVNGRKIELVLLKSSESMWTSCMENSPGKEEIDDSLAKMAEEKLSHMTSDVETDPPPTLASSAIMEECDFVEVISRYLVRLDLQSQKLTHKIQLGDEQWLMTLPIEGDKVPALCIRNDVDGSVWQPDAPAPSGEWPCEHILNFHALGYVQASKEKRKFIISPPSGSYVAIVEIDGRVFIFRQSVMGSGTLKNRFSGKSTQNRSVQQVIPLGAQDPVLGAVAEEFHLFVLTRSHFYCLNFTGDY